MTKIAKLSAMRTPPMVVDGKIVVIGRVATVAELMTLLHQ